MSLRYGIPLLIISFTAALAAYTVHRDRASAEAVVRGEAVSYMINRMGELQKRVSDAWAQGNRGRIMDDIALIAGEGEAQQALLAGDDSQVLAATSREWVGQPLYSLSATQLAVFRNEPVGILLDRVRAQAGGEVHVIAEGRYVVGAYPVVLGPDRVGVLVVQKDLARDLARARGAIAQHTAEMVAMLASLALTLGVLVHFFVSRRLGLLVKATTRFAAGDLNARANLRGKDEVAHLGRAFDQMATEVAGTQRHLERSVASRTAELARMVAKLQTEIGKRRRTQRALFHEKERIQVTLASIGDAVITTDVSGRIEYLNRSAEMLAGRPKERVIGSTLAETFAFIDENTGLPAQDPVAQCIRDRTVIEVANCALAIGGNGPERSIDLSAAPISDRAARVRGAVLVCRDVTDIRQATKRLSYQASHDPLTGLVNRQEFERRLERVLSTATAEESHALLYLDLDQFKIVNDTCGHAAGDELLRQISLVLGPEVQKRDTLARLGGDEFGVLLEHCVPDQSLVIADKLRTAMHNFRFVWENRSFSVGVSIGVVPIRPGNDNLASVLRAADSACYAAKEQGRNRVHVFQTGDQELAQRHGQMQWVPRIQEALAENRFMLFFQPIVPLNRADQMHCEVLLRLVNREGSLAPPSVFIPAAERYNQMQAIDRWVVRNVFAALCDPGIVPHSVCLAINLSGQSLGDPQFLQYVSDEVENHAVPLDRICFEITETAAISNLSHARRFFAALKPGGCRFALDDFGSGLSSFRYLKDLPVDFLKIDGCFVKDMVRDPINHAMVEAIHSVGHVMGIKTIAEFVESQSIISMLKEIGVDYAQGYALGEPRPFGMMRDLPSSVGDEAVGSGVVTRLKTPGHS
ncbi:EAL domain-containing protein [Methylococcus sp. EFPC2]|uniref:EAL domain-containing protein n=1 Tax=Methylococcus sp. EFPC2 TaxID=2812648 RepID=UPI001967DF21|nr:EAL domain-containing protein [Methylococcus sp. EFPC2]QSA98168.1 EAL domain-containing protein [Methylococcus sp. EFPC2]